MNIKAKSTLMYHFEFESIRIFLIDAKFEFPTLFKLEKTIDWLFNISRSDNSKVLKSQSLLFFNSNSCFSKALVSLVNYSIYILIKKI